MKSFQKIFKKFSHETYFHVPSVKFFRGNASSLSTSNTLASEWGPRIGFVWYGLSSCSQTLLQCSLSTSIIYCSVEVTREHCFTSWTLDDSQRARARRACRSASITLNEREAHAFSSPMSFPCNNSCFLSYRVHPLVQLS